jgi:ribokinase
VSDTPEDWARLLLAKGPRSVVVTLGAQGSLVASSAGMTRVASVKVDAVDTTGAGDAFTAALAFRLGAGSALAEAASYASRVGAVAVTRKGAQDSFPTADEVEALCCASPGGDPRTPGRGPDEAPGATRRGESL